VPGVLLLLDFGQARLVRGELRLRLEAAEQFDGGEPRVTAVPMLTFFTRPSMRGSAST